MPNDKSTGPSPVKNKQEIEWFVPQGLLRPYATNVVVQVQDSGNEVMIAFFDIQPPIITGTPEERKEKAGKAGAIPAYCIANVIMSIDKLPKIIKVMQGIYDKVKGKKAKVSDDSE